MYYHGCSAMNKTYSQTNNEFIIMLFLWVIKHCGSIYNDDNAYINKSLMSTTYIQMRFQLWLE